MPSESAVSWRSRDSPFVVAQGERTKDNDDAAIKPRRECKARGASRTLQVASCDAG